MKKNKLVFLILWAAAGSLLLSACQSAKQAAAPGSLDSAASLTSLLKNPDAFKRQWQANLDFEPLDITTRGGHVYIVGNKAQFIQPPDRRSSKPTMFADKLARLLQPTPAEAKGAHRIEAGVAEAYNQKTGRRLWRKTFPNELPAEEGASVFLDSAATPEGLLVVKSEPAKSGDQSQVMRFMVLDYKTGAVKWRAPFAYSGDPQPIVRDSLVIFAGTGRPNLKSTGGLIAEEAVFAYDLRARKQAWRFAAKVWQLHRQNDRLYFYQVLDDSGLKVKPTALNVGTGKPVWQGPEFITGGTDWLVAGKKLLALTQIRSHTKPKQAVGRGEKHRHSLKIIVLNNKTGRRTGAIRFNDLDSDEDAASLVDIVSGKGRDVLLFYVARNRQGFLDSYAADGRKLNSFYLGKDVWVERLPVKTRGYFIQVGSTQGAGGGGGRPMRRLLVNLEPGGEPKAVWGFAPASAAGFQTHFAADESAGKLYVSRYREQKTTASFSAYRLPSFK